MSKPSLRARSLACGFARTLNPTIIPPEARARGTSLSLIPPTPPPWDDAFTQVRGTPTVYWEDALQIKIESDAPYWVVYDQDSDGVCVEPQTAPADAANLGISSDTYLEALFVFEEI